MTDTPSPRLPHWAAPVGLAVLVVVLAVVALVRGEGNADPMTPEGALRLYLQGIADGDWEQAYRFLDPDDFTGCDPEDIANSAPADSFTALHQDTRIRDGSASIVMEFTFGDGRFMGWTQMMEFRLVERDGFWYLTGDPWPNFRWSCR